MAPLKTYDITLHLERIQHLFQLPELDPFAGQDHSLSRIEQILSELKPQPLMCQVHTTILLPQANFSKSIEQTCQNALPRYCQTRIHHN